MSQPLWRARNERNYFFVGLLVLLAAGIVCTHLAVLGVVEVPPWVGVQLRLDVIFFIMAVLALAIAVVHIVRLALWDTRATLRVPQLWVLHFAYAWIPVHLLLRVAGEAGWVMRSLAVHALTIGAIGGLNHRHDGA